MLRRVVKKERIAGVFEGNPIKSPIFLVDIASPLKIYSTAIFYCLKIHFQ